MVINEEELLCSPCQELHPALVTNEEASPDATLMLEDKDKCIFCMLEPKKKSQAYGGNCEAMVRGAIRDAEAQGPGAAKALKLLKKRSPAEYVKAVFVYHSKCSGVGRGSRRPAFAWQQYWLAVELKSTVLAGTKFLWVTKGYWKHKQRIDDELSDAEAEAAWHNHWDDLADGEKCKTTFRVLMLVEDFIIKSDEKSTLERTTVGYNASFNFNFKFMNSQW